MSLAGDRVNIQGLLALGVCNDGEKPLRSMGRPVSKFFLTMITLNIEHQGQNPIPDSRNVSL